MAVTFVETPVSQLHTVTSIEASRRKKFPPARDLTAPRLGGWEKLPAVVAADYAYKKSVTPEGFAAIQAMLEGKSKWVRKSDFSAVSSWLTSLALRRLNEVAAMPSRELTLFEIQNYDRAEDLFEFLYDRALDVLPYDYSEKNDLVAQTYRVVDFALEIHRPEWMETLRARGRKGGKVSKRPKVWTVKDLERVAGKSKSIQAEELGCSVPTISRLRREAAQAVSDKPVSA